MGWDGRRDGHSFLGMEGLLGMEERMNINKCTGMDRVSGTEDGRKIYVQGSRDAVGMKNG